MSILKIIQRWSNKKNLGVKGNRKRVGILFFTLSFFILAILISRFVWIVEGGKIQGVDLGKQTAALYKGTNVVKAKRGNIYDRYGQPIAQDAMSYSVYAILKTTYIGANEEKLYAQAKNFDSIADILHDKLGMDKTMALSRLRVNAGKSQDEEQFQVEFGSSGQNISLSTKEEIEKEMEKRKLKGLYFTEQQSRIYPNGDFASNFIGVASQNDEGQIVGKYGLEAAFNDVLQGENGTVTYKRDIAGNPMPGTVANKVQAKDGQDIYTTLDSRLQTYLETLMEQVNKEYKPENLTAILMEAKTGEILAMSQRPSLSPEAKEIPKDAVWRNMLVEDSFEPGSTMKIFTTAASVNTGQFKANDTFTAGEIKVYDRTIRDHDWGKNGPHPLTYRQALAWSSNVGMVHLEQRLGSLWPAYQRRFLFGSNTDSGLNMEVSGLLPDVNSPVDLAMSSFGQGINVTNFQMMRAFSSIANNGTMLQPHYISKVVNIDKKTQQIVEPEILGQPVTSETAHTVLEYMVDVVEDPQWGSAHWKEGPIYNVPNVTLSAKTGTAQIGDEKNGGYFESKYINSVVLMAPTNEPKYVLYVTMRMDGTMPPDAISKLANPMLKRALESEEMPVDNSKGNIEDVVVQKYTGKTANQAETLARKQLLQPISLGDGTNIIAQSTNAGAKLLPNAKIFFKTDGDMLMPDVTGWSREDLEKFEKMVNVKLTITGEGRAYGQSVVSGEKIKVSQTIEIQLG
ncbi:penicillin-binding protein 2X [Pilibacter termitis]|uniref:Penicillin-binding protein 2X n=1 Tax=Pilibacter termitis TaxID=263852 RepID=A0A1T4KEX5_9ENTE|nr:penicillin-binding protein [Pilibacter termitis]SJZ40893.1 penicillin-binding protein 2X [Pilibacter termitis]